MVGYGLDMATVLAWMMIGVILLGAFTFLILTPLAWLTRGLTEILKALSTPRQATPSPTVHVPIEPDTDHLLGEGGLRVATVGTRPNPAEPTINSSGVDISFGVWGATIVPYTKELARLIGMFGPMIHSGDERGICGTAMGIVDELDQIESAIPPPPHAEAEVHWSAMILLLRRSCESAVEGVEVTRNLKQASDLLARASGEMAAMARIMTDWTTKLDSGQLT